MRSHAALALLVAGAALSLFWLVHPWYDARNDASMYIVTARSLLAGEGYAYLGEPFRMRPPGFSVLIAPVLAIFGTSFTALNAYVGLFGVLCVASLFLHLRSRLGVHLALAVSAVVWMNPGFRALCGQVLSDVPGAALMLAALVLEPWARRRPLWRDAPLGLLVAAATYVRSQNGLLVPAIVLARLLRRRDPSEPAASFPRRLARQATLLAAVPLLALLPWSLRNAAIEDTGPAEQTYHYSYAVAMWHEDGADPASPRLPLRAVLERAPERLGEIVPVLGGRMDPEPGGPALALGVAALGCWLVVLARRREASEILVGLILLVLSVYFSFAVRLVLPLYLLVLPAVVEVVLSALRRLVPARGAEAGAVALVVALGALDAAPRAEWDAIAAGHRERQEVADYVAARHPTTPLGASIGWDLAVHLGRPVYSLQIATHRDGIEGARRIIAREGIGVVMLNKRQGGGRVLFRHLTSRFGIAESLPGADIVVIPNPERLGAAAPPRP